MAEQYKIRLFRGPLASMLNQRADVGTPILAKDVGRVFFGNGPNLAPSAQKIDVADVINLLVNGKFRYDLMPSIAITSLEKVDTPADRDALTFSADNSPSDIQPGDYVNVEHDHDDEDGNPVSQLYLVTNSGEFTPIIGSGGGSGGIQSINNMVGPNVILDTSDIEEGGGVLYYTDARVNAVIAGLINIAGGLAGLDQNGYIRINVIPPSIVRAGDDATRLGAGTAQNPVPAGQILQSVGDGTTQWSDTVDGGEFN